MANSVAAAVRPVVLAAVLVAGAALLTACTDAGPASVDPASPSVTRWWSTPESTVGSAIGAADAADATSRLTPDTASYCQALDDTEAAGNGLFPEGTQAESPTYRLAATTFVREIQAMAPDEVRSSWQTLGGVILALVDASGDAAALKLPDGVTAADIDAANTAITAHALSACGLTLGAAQ